MDEKSGQPDHTQGRADEHKTPFSATDFIMFGVGGLIAEPLCHAGWDSVVIGEHTSRGDVAIAIGLLIGSCAASFHWWKDRVGATARTWIPIILVPLSVVLAFIFFAGPDIYQRVTQRIIVASEPPQSLPGDTAKIAELQRQITTLQESLRAANKKVVAQSNPPPAAPAPAPSREPANYQAFYDWQKRVFIDEIVKLKPMIPKILIVRVQSIYTQGFYRSWEEVFQRVGIPIDADFQNAAGPEEVGIMVAVKDPSHPPYVALQLIDVIKEIGYNSVNIVQLSDKNAALDHGYDFAIFLGLPPVSP